MELTTDDRLAIRSLRAGRPHAGLRWSRPLRRLFVPGGVSSTISG